MAAVQEFHSVSTREDCGSVNIDHFECQLLSRENVTMISLLELYDQIRKLILDDEVAGLGSENLIGHVFGQTRSIDWTEVFKKGTGSEVSEESCLKIRDAGTKFFQKNKLQEAIECYNEHLRSCHRLEDGEVKLRLLQQGKK